MMTSKIGRRLVSIFLVLVTLSSLVLLTHGRSVSILSDNEEMEQNGSVWGEQSASAAVSPESVIQSLDFLMRYLSSKSRQLPIDTLYGLKGMEGMLLDKYIDLKRSGTDEPLLSKLHGLLGAARALSRSAKGAVQRRWPVDWDRFAKIVHVPLTPPAELAAPRKHKIAKNELFAKNSTVAATFSEEQSDRCLAQALRCKVTVKCVRQMSPSGNGSGADRAYITTHKLLYFLFLKQQRCNCNKHHHQLDLQKQVDALVDRMTEEHIGEKGRLLVDFDLQMERVMLGTMTGHVDKFIDMPLVKRVLALQDEKLGCWKSEYNNKVGAPSVLRDVDSGDGCSLHASGLVAYVLSAYLRYVNVFI